MRGAIVTKANNPLTFSSNRSIRRCIPHGWAQASVATETAEIADLPAHPSSPHPLDEKYRGHADDCWGEPSRATNPRRPSGCRNKAMKTRGVGKVEFACTIVRYLVLRLLVDGPYRIVM